MPGRLFGLNAGAVRVRATFWVLDAPDSLEVQGRRNVDGSGIGFFDSAGAPVLDKQPEPAFIDDEFIHAATRRNGYKERGRKTRGGCFPLPLICHA
jgi:predicted glutamine amidotransferase